MSATNKVRVSFWRVFWPSLIAGCVLILLFFILFTSVIGSLMKSKPTYEVKNKTILHMKLDGAIGEISQNEVNFTGLGVDSKTGLADILYGLEKAADDDHVKGIYIELGSPSCGLATATAIRDAIHQFEEKSGKFVIAYHKGESVSLKQYYIASAATKNYAFPTTNFEFLGLGAELMFYKGLFDKLGLEMQVVRGKDNAFKSAVEPYFLSEMSDSSRLQISVYMNNLWTAIKKNISEDRGISLDELDNIANNALVRRMDQALEHKLIDSVLYRDEVLQILADKVGAKDFKDLNLSNFEKYAQAKFENQQELAHAKTANVAVIIAEGEITVDGNQMASNRLTKLIREARKDKNIKTIVLRINSPGGSALASEEIWREVKLANDEKKVVVSMGDVAASGGYYISTPSSKVFAEKTTITGSIGVFGVIPFTGKMLEEKLGITFDRVSTNPHAVLSLNKKFTPEEFEMIQEEVNSTYSLFLQRVADGRKTTPDQINKVARGRVWTGVDALRIGLVDTLGSLQDAIDFAVKQAGIEDPSVRYYPKVKKDIWMEMVDIINSDDEDDVKAQKTIVPQEISNLYYQVKRLENLSGVQARIPYEINW
ncbi:MAG: signal peptide peptidase SppA [Brumimicrobium sp.]|nr:signal peptide peptidase SppA [Brumimicrobium sp.]